MRGDLENIVTLLILALLGGGIQAVKAWLERKKEAPEQKKSGNAPDIAGDTDAAKEAKMRRFMEALGLPADEVLPPQQQPPQHRAVPTTQPTAPTTPTAHPMGPGPHPWATTKPSTPTPGAPSTSTASTGEESYEERMAARRRELKQLKEARGARKRAAQPPTASAAPSQPTVQPTAHREQPPRQTHSFDLASPASQSLSRVHRIEKRPAQKASKAPSKASAAPLRESLRTPAELRRAFILKEILGRPKALEPLEGRPA